MFYLPNILNAGNTGPGVGRKTYWCVLGLKDNEYLPRNQNKD